MRPLSFLSEETAVLLKKMEQVGAFFSHGRMGVRMPIWFSAMVQPGVQWSGRQREKRGTDETVGVVDLVGDGGVWR